MVVWEGNTDSNLRRLFIVLECWCLRTGTSDHLLSLGEFLVQIIQL